MNQNYRSSNEEGSVLFGCFIGVDWQSPVRVDLQKLEQVINLLQDAGVAMEQQNSDGDLKLQGDQLFSQARGLRLWLMQIRLNVNQGHYWATPQISQLQQSCNDIAELYNVALTFVH
jgi:hypothetical protein